jgi:hypothetical protein
MANDQNGGRLLIFIKKRMKRTYTSLPIHQIRRLRKWFHFVGDLKPLEIWNPHTGESKKVELLKTTVNNQKITTFKLNRVRVSVDFNVKNENNDNMIQIVKIIKCLTYIYLKNFNKFGENIYL